MRESGTAASGLRRPPFFPPHQLSAGSQKPQMAVYHTMCGC